MIQQKKDSVVKQCDNIEFAKKALSIIEQITAIINHKDTLNLLLVRSKPRYCFFIKITYRVASQRIVQRLLTGPKLCEKYKDSIVASEKKERELIKEIEMVKK